MSLLLCIPLVSLERPNMFQFFVIISVRLLEHGLKVCTRYVLSLSRALSVSVCFLDRRSSRFSDLHFSMFLFSVLSG